MPDNIALEVLDGIREAGAKAQEPAKNPPAAPSGKEGSADTDIAEALNTLPMDEIARYQGENVSSELIFGNEGRNLSQKSNSPQYAKKLAWVAERYADMLTGKLGMRWLHESMMSSEFTALLGDTLDRVLLAKYATYQPSYRQFLRGRRARDFRPVGSVRRHGGNRLERVPEGTSYPRQSLAESNYSYQVAKYGKTYEITWEMIVNDDLDAFTSLPDDMADDAIQTEMYLASALYVANPTLFQAARGAGLNNKITTPLSIAAIETAYNTMLGFPGDGNMVIHNMPVILVVPPKLKIKAFRELGVLNLAGTAGTVTLQGVTNVLAGELTILVDPYIPVLDPTNGNTSWYLFADPNRIHGAEYAFLTGYEQPQVFMKSPNAIRMGGGSDQGEVDYDRDTRGYKTRHVFGGNHANATGGWRGCLWSDGTS